MRNRLFASTVARVSFVFVYVVVLTLSIVSVGASSVSATFVDGNPTCSDLGYDFGYKPEPQNWPEGIYDIADTGAITIVPKADGLTSWSATFGIDAVIVKGNNGANVYEYIPEESSDTNLVTPINASGGSAGLSHVEFCYDYEGDDPETVIPDVPLFADLICGEDGSYDIPTTEGVEYSIGDGLQTAGTHLVAEAITITVTAQAADGYELAEGADASWTYVFTLPTVCDVTPLAEATAITPTYSDFTCKTKGTHVIPEVEGVSYYIGETEVTAGTYEVAVYGDIVVTAKANHGYELVGTAAWTLTFTAPTNCSQVLGDSTHGQVLGDSTTTPSVLSGAVLANTGNSPVIMAVIGLTLVGMAIGIAVLPRKAVRYYIGRG